jgi:DNA-binding NtrC family response regulator
VRGPNRRRRPPRELDTEPASTTASRRPGLYHRILREIEFPLLSAALAATRGNQIRAADLLSVNPNTLRKKIRDLDIADIARHCRRGDRVREGTVHAQNTSAYQATPS